MYKIPQKSSDLIFNNQNLNEAFSLGQYNFIDNGIIYVQIKNQNPLNANTLPSR